MVSHQSYMTQHSSLKWFLTFTNTPNPEIVFQSFVEPHSAQYNRKKKWVTEITFFESLKALRRTLEVRSNPG